MMGVMARGNSVIVILFAAIVVALLALRASWVSYPYMWMPRHVGGMMGQPVGDLEVYYTVKAVVSSVNAVLLFGLLVTYLEIYKNIRSEFSLGLIIFSLALLLYAVTSNPLFHGSFGFAGYGLGPFAVLPDLFTTIASAIILYISTK
jgi:hypothetical protein